MYQVTIPGNFVGQDFKHQACNYANRVIHENEDVNISNDYFWKSNEYVGEDCVGQKLDLTSLINKKNGYLKGKLEDAGDVDYYHFDTRWYKGFSAVDKYNVDITVTIDHIPAECDYDLVLYDENGNQVGIGTDNGKGGKSISVPNWNWNNHEYTVKVQAKDGTIVKADEYYHLSFQTKQADKNHGAYKQMEEMQEHLLFFRKKLHEGKDTTIEKTALEEIREKYNAEYEKQLHELHKEQAKQYIENLEVFDENIGEELLAKMATGEELTEQESVLVKIYATAQKYDSAVAQAKLHTTITDKITSYMQAEGVDLSGYSFEMQIRTDGKVTISGVEDQGITEKIEKVISHFSEELLEVFFSVKMEQGEYSKEECSLLKRKMDVEKFLLGATKGSVSFSDITVKNGKINGLPDKLNSLINRQGTSLYYADYREDILAIKQYEHVKNKDFTSFYAKYAVKEGKFQI